MNKCAFPFILGFSLALSIAAASCASGGRNGLVSPADYGGLMSRGMAHMAANALEPARHEFNQALRAVPRSSRAMNMIGLTYLREKRNSEAQAWFRKAVEADPGYAPAFVNLGAAQALAGRLEQGRETLERALVLNPRSISANISLGSICFELGDMEKGSFYLKHAFELDPESPLRGGGLQTFLTMSSWSLGEMYFAYASFYAAAGDRGRTLEMLNKAGAAGFKNWKRIDSDKDFEGLRNDMEIRKFIKTE